MRDNIVSFANPALVESRPARTRAGAQAIEACHGAVERALPQYLSNYFEKLDDALYELADKSDNNSLQTSYFEAMRELRKQRPSMEQHFIKRVLSGLKAFWDRGPVPVVVVGGRRAPVSEDEFDLTPEDDLEELLAVSNITSKSDNRYQRELHGLSRRFGALLGGIEVANDANPLAPATFCTAFRDGIRHIDLDIPVKLVIYKLFDKQVMHHLGSLYSELNGILINAGILPKLTFKPGKSEAARGHWQDVRQGPESSASKEEEPDTELFASMIQLLEQRRGRRVEQGGNRVARGEILQGLSALQRASLDDWGAVPISLSPADIKHRLDLELAHFAQSGQVKELGRVDQDTIDVVEMLFEFILEDHALPDAMRALIGRLQIPILRVAINDKTFFSRKAHPARKLLNSLAQAAIGWSDDGDRSEGSLFGHIDAVVKAVLVGYQDDVSLFDQLDGEFSDYLEQEQHGARIAEERTTQVTEGKERINAAKEVVGWEIDRRLNAAGAVPEAVVALLREGWQDVMLLAYLREGPESEAWARDLKLMDELLWSIEPKEEYDQRQALLRHIPELLRGLREGLDRISFDPHKTARLFKELQSCHINCLRGTPIERLSGHRDSAIVEQPPTLTKRSMADGALDPAMMIARNLNLGTWLEFSDRDGPCQRLKLSWRSDVTDTCMLVNRKGMKAREISVAELADALRGGQAEILQGGGDALMDRALAAMMKMLKKSPYRGPRPDKS